VHVQPSAFKIDSGSVLRTDKNVTQSVSIQPVPYGFFNRYGSLESRYWLRLGCLLSDESFPLLLAYLLCLFLSVRADWELLSGG